MVASESLQKREHPTLIVCRAFEQTKILLRFIRSKHKCYIVASDDIRVHNLLAQYPTIIQVLWLSQMDTLYSVSESVVGVIKEVNNWLKYDSGCHPSIQDLIYWPMHCEGGTTSQRVLDFLLIEKSYESLLMISKPAELIIFNDLTAAWEDELMIEIARKNKIPVKILGPVFLSNLHYKNIWLYIRPLASAIYRTCQILKAKFEYILTDRFHDNNGQIAIQLVSRSMNHLNTAKVLLHTLLDEGLDPIVIGWRLGASASDLIKEGLKCVRLEQLVTLSSLVSTWYWILASRWRVRCRLSVFPLTDSYCRNPKVLKNTLKRSVLDFYFNELLDRALLKSASGRYFSDHKTKALRLYSIILPYGRIVFREFRRAFPESPVFIQGGWPYNLYEPITSKEAPVPLNQIVFFACSRQHQKILIDMGFCIENVILTGLPWLDELMDFSHKTSKLRSREKLGLHEGDWFLLLDTNNAVSGYLSPQEQQKVLVMMLNFASDNSNCILMIKPHPTSKASIVNELIAEYALPNVKLIASSILPYDALNASDLLITKMSTLALEAMYLNVPTIGIILDNERNWKVYEEGIEYQFSLYSLRTRLQELMDDQLKRQVWCKELTKRQRSFFEGHGLKESYNRSRDLPRLLADKLETAYSPNFKLKK